MSYCSHLMASLFINTGFKSTHTITNLASNPSGSSLNRWTDGTNLAFSRDRRMSSREPTTCGLTSRSARGQSREAFRTAGRALALAICAEASARTLQDIAFAHWSPHVAAVNDVTPTRYKRRANGPRVEHYQFRTIVKKWAEEWPPPERLRVSHSDAEVSKACEEKQFVQNFLEQFHKRSSAFTGRCAGRKHLNFMRWFLLRNRRTRRPSGSLSWFLSIDLYLLN